MTGPGDQGCATQQHVFMLVAIVAVYIATAVAIFLIYEPAQLGPVG
jgi:hypothetical protein